LLLQIETNFCKGECPSSAKLNEML